MELPEYDPGKPLTGPVLIYGVGEIGLFLSRHFETLNDVVLLGFLDTFKKGRAHGMSIHHPHERAYPIEGVTVVLSMYALDQVIPLLLEMGYTKLVYGVPFFEADRNMRVEQTAIVSKIIEEGHYQQAIDRLTQLIADFPCCDAFYTLLGMAHTGLKSHAALPVFVEALQRYPNMQLYRSLDFRFDQADAIARGLPSIFLNTQFKSGSVFLRSALCEGLKMPWLFLSPEGYVGTQVETWRQEFSRGGAICQYHLGYGDDFARIYQEKTRIKFILHLRDPRQSALSAIHHYESVLKHGPPYARHNILLNYPKGYETWPFEKKLDYYLGLVPPALSPDFTNFEREVNWLDGWLEALETRELSQVAVTDYSDLKNGQERFVRLLLEKCEIPAELFDFSQIRQQPTPGQAHFRKGDPNEWRSAMTAAQIEVASAMMTPRLRARYG